MVSHILFILKHCIIHIIQIQMVPIVQKSVDSLVKVFGEKAEAGKSFEFFRFVHKFDAITFNSLSKCST